MGKLYAFLSVLLWCNTDLQNKVFTKKITVGEDTSDLCKGTWGRVAEQMGPGSPDFWFVPRLKVPSELRQNRNVFLIYKLPLWVSVLEACVEDCTYSVSAVCRLFAHMCTSRSPSLVCGFLEGKAELPAPSSVLPSCFVCASLVTLDHEQALVSVSHHIIFSQTEAVSYSTFYALFQHRALCIISSQKLFTVE